jgi:hypothetical protein
MIFSLLFLTICIPINVAIWWVYRKRRNPHQAPRVGPQLQNTIGLQPSVGNAAAKAKADRIERRLLFFAIITFFGHVLIALYLVSQMNMIVILCHFMDNITSKRETLQFLSV